MKIFLCGQKYFGYLIFKLCQDLGHEVVGVCSPEGDRLSRAAALAEVPIIIPSGKRLFNHETMPSGVDLIVAAHSYDYVGMKTLAKTKLGGIGYHPSLLPLHRGRDAIRWAIKMGDRVTGGSVYWLSKNVDAGPIAAQDWCFVPPGCDATDLWREKLQPMGVRLMAITLNDISNGKLVRVPQDPSLVTWEPSLEQPPIFRPDLAQIGAIEGYTVIASNGKFPSYHVSDRDWWKRVAGG